MTLPAIREHAEIDRARLAAELTRALDRFKTGNGRTPAFSPDFRDHDARHGPWRHRLRGFADSLRLHRIVARAPATTTVRMSGKSATNLPRISAEALRKNFRRSSGIQEDEPARQRSGSGTGSAGASPAGGQDAAPRPVHGQPHRAGARSGKIDPVIGRDAEIRQMVDILIRRRQNNPILTGEAGVGKTAVVEGFALRIAQGDVPPPLQERRAPHARPGAAPGRRRVKGEFENRLKR